MNKRAYLLCDNFSNIYRLSINNVTQPAYKHSFMTTHTQKVLSVNLLVCSIPHTLYNIVTLYCICTLAIIGVCGYFNAFQPSPTLSSHFPGVQTEVVLYEEL